MYVYLTVVGEEQKWQRGVEAAKKRAFAEGATRNMSSFHASSRCWKLKTTAIPIGCSLLVLFGSCGVT